MQRNNARRIALGGVLAAVAVVILCLGGLIPVATYVCPMLCCMTLFLVMRYCGKRLGWAWFAVVVVLSFLFGPDKEAAIVFLAIGYYPLVKSWLGKCKLSIVIKLLFFNVSILAGYAVLIYLMGMRELISENMELGAIGFVTILLLGNVTFLLLDRLLSIMARKIR